MGAPGNGDLYPVVITGEDQTADAWDSVKRNARQTGDAIDQFKSRLEQLSSGGGGGFGQISKLSDAFGKLRSVAGLPALGIGGVIVGTGIAATLAHQKLSELGKAAEETGERASTIDGLSRSLERVGGKSDDAVGSLKSLRKAIDEAAEGEGEQVSTLEGLFEVNNVKLNDAAGKVKSLGAVYGDVSKLIVNAASETDRLVIATIAFGSDAAPAMVRAIVAGETSLEKLGKAGDVALDDATKRAREFDAMLKNLTGSADTLGRRLVDAAKGWGLSIIQFGYERGTEIGALLGSKSAQQQLSIFNTRRQGGDARWALSNQREIDEFYNATGGAVAYDKNGKPISGGATKVKKPLAEEADATKNAFDRQVESIAKHIATVEADAKAVDATAGEHAKLRAEAQLLEAAQRAGIPVVGKVAEKFEELKARAREAADALAYARLKSDVFFERQQLGRTDIEREVAQKLRSAGIDPNSENGKFLAENIRLNSTLSETKDLSKDALKPLLDDALKGKFSLDSLSAAADRLKSKLADKTLDFGLSLLFKSIGGLGGAPSSGLTDAGFSLAGSSAAAVKFHRGGLVGRDGERVFVHPAHFNDAPRLHGGGMIGPDEVPAILQRGERVIPRGGSGGGPNITVHINQNLGGANGDEAVARIAMAMTQRGMRQVLAQVPGVSVRSVNEYSNRFG